MRSGRSSGRSRPSTALPPAAEPAPTPETIGRPLRILHLNFHRGWGGQPQRILLGSVEIARRGHAVALAVPDDSILAARARDHGLAVFGGVTYRPPSHALSFLRDVRAVRAIVSDWRPDILHSHGSQDTWVAVAANRWGPGTAGVARLPHVLTRHNTKRVADSLANRYLYGRCVDLLVVASRSVLDRYEPFLRRGLLRPDRIRVIHSSVDVERFSSPADPRRIRAELGLGAENALVGCIGRLVPDKGHRWLLEAAARLRPAHPGARYVFAGTGTEEASLRRQVRDLGLDDRVTFLGFRTDVADITASLDLAVLPSVDCDASSAVIKEAMLSGKAVVATDIGGAAEILRPEQAGLVVPPADPGALAAAIGRMLDAPGEARAMGVRGREIVLSDYTTGRLADRYLEAYTSLLARGRSGSAVPA